MYYSVLQHSCSWYLEFVFAAEVLVRLYVIETQLFACKWHSYLKKGVMEMDSKLKLNNDYYDNNNYNISDSAAKAALKHFI